MDETQSGFDYSATWHALFRAGLNPSDVDSICDSILPTILETKSSHAGSQTKDTNHELPYSAPRLRQARPRHCRKRVGMTLTTTTNADPIPALGATPTFSNMGENLEEGLATTEMRHE